MKNNEILLFINLMVAYQPWVFFLENEDFVASFRIVFFSLSSTLKFENKIQDISRLIFGNGFD